MVGCGPVNRQGGGLEDLKRLRMAKRGEERVLRGHPWIFSNQVEGEIKSYEPGELVEVRTHDGKFVGIAYVNPHSLIAARLLTRQREEIGAEFLRRRLRRAQDYRDRFAPGLLSYRWVFSEADDLPGVIVDRYGDCLSAQVLTAGMDRRKDALREALLDTFPARAIVLKNDSSIRRLEGLPLETMLWHGKLDAPVEIEEGGVTFLVDLVGGQKTGFYFDQRENRAALARMKPAGRVLDCFCYTGAWGLAIARAVPGVEILGIDESAPAVELARENARRNDLDRFVAHERAEVFNALEGLGAENREYDTVILDPPAMVKSRAKILEGYRGYRRLHRLAGRVVKRRGLLATSCCSHLMSFDQFTEAVAEGLARSNRSGRIVHVGHQAVDHPIDPAVPETNYLKFLVLELN